jgi:hypothetical protein
MHAKFLGFFVLLATLPAHAAELVHLKACEKAAGSKTLQELDHSIQALANLVAQTKETAGRASSLGELKIVNGDYDSSQRASLCNQTYNTFGAALSAASPVVKQIDQVTPAVATLKFEDSQACLSQLKQLRETYQSKPGLAKEHGLGLSLYPTVRAACGTRALSPFLSGYRLTK